MKNTDALSAPSELANEGDAVQGVLGSMTREQQILVLASQGKPDKEISAILGIKFNTVATYWSRVLNRYGASSRSEVIAMVLNETLRNYQLAIEQSPEPIIVLSKGQVIYANQKAAELTGYESPSAMLGISALSYVHDEDRALISERIATVNRGEANPSQRFRIVRKNGQVVWAEGVSTPTTWEGKPALLANFRDRTREVEAELLLKHRVDMLEALVDGLPDLLFVMSPDGTYLDFRESQYGRPFVPGDQFLGRQYREILPPPVAAKFDIAFQELIRTGEVQSISFSFERDGATESYSAKLTRMTDGNVLIVVRQLQ